MLNDPWDMTAERSNGAQTVTASPSPRLQAPRIGPSLYTFTWGKHRDSDIEDVPASYVRWCLDNLDWLTPGHERFSQSTWEAFRQAIGLPLEFPVSPPPVTDYAPKMPPGTASEGLKRAIKRWYGSLSMRYHPDKGGTAEQMAVVNECHDSLIKIIRDMETKK
jgi:hypothetical protein